MRLKQLEIHGFKSFADRTNFTFLPGVTAIVGEREQEEVISPMLSAG